MKKDQKILKPVSVEKDDFKSIEPIRSPVLAWVIKVVPILMVLALPLILWENSPLKVPGKEMFSTGLFAAALALFAFQILMDRISTIFGTLWRRGSILGRKGKGKSKKEAVVSYRQFVKGVEDQLNNKYQWAMGGVFAVLVQIWYIPILLNLGSGFIILLGLVVEIIIALLIGTVVWRMVSVSWQVWHLPEEYELEIQVVHPDQCGGLEPLGNLCLWNALILAVAGIYLGGWISIGPNTQFAEYAATYDPIFRVLLIVPIILSFVSFLLPLWTTHRVMSQKKAEIQIRLDELAKSIYAESTVLLNKTGDLDFAKGDERNKRLSLMRNVYSQHQRIPTWPINTNIIYKFAAAQAMPVLSFIGFADPFVKVLSDVFKLTVQNGF
ncbi:MAG TPA: hypothetical protein VLA72_02930 [Anaerolineales bacterium]|nr:hypothetical protein [Anaerolineales bacterium]